MAGHSEKNNSEAGRNLQSRPVWIGFAVFAALLALTQFLTYQRYQLNKANEQREIAFAANVAKEGLQSTLAHSFSTARTLAFIIEKYGPPKKFDEIAKPLLLANEFIDAVQILKKGVISEEYPLKGNEAAIGYDIFSDSVQKKVAMKAIERKNFYFFGPLELQQGGLGILVRQPVFIKNKFWGFSGVVIKFPHLMKTAGIDSSANSDFVFQLSKINPLTNQEEFFLPNPENFDRKNVVKVKVPDGEWNLYVQRKQSRNLWLTVAFVSLGVLLSLTGGFFAWFFARQPQELGRMVKEKTQQLRASENNYRTVLNRINDAVVSVDSEWRYTFLNDAALTTHPAGREATLGKIIWEVHPEMEGTVFQKKYYEAMQTGKAQEVESYYPPLDTWFSVKVYPSSDGLTIFYKDITVAKKSEEQLRREKELSDSVINSLPGIFYLYDETGKFLRWNKNFETVSGYTGEEISNMHPLDFFDDDEKQLLTEKIQSVFAGGSDEVEAHFLTKERKKIPYYFNGWITEYENRKCLLGVGIDITERKKTEMELRISNERFGLSAKATNDIIWDWNLKDNSIWWNENFYSVFNYRREDVPLVIDFWDKRLHPDDMERVSNKIRVSIENRENIWTDEYRFLDSGNNIFYIYDRGYIMYDANNEPLRMIGAMINITELKKTEEALLKKTQDLNERVKELNCLYHVSAIINKRGIQTKMLLQNCVEIIPSAYLQPEKTSVRITILSNEFRSQNFMESKWKQETEIVMGENVAGKIEVFYTAKNEQEENFFLPEEDEMLRSIARNIGLALERKKAERDIRVEKELSDTIINSLPGIFYLTDANGKFLRWNKNFETVSGYTGEEISAMRGTDFFEAEDKNLLLYRKELAIQKGSADMEAEFVTKDKTKIPYFFTGRRIEYDGNSAMLGVGIDISQRKKAETELQLMNEQLRQLSSHLENIREEERTHIAREIHDELGQQLTGLKMDIAWIKNKSEKEYHFPLLREKTNDMIDLVNTAISSVRRIAKELRPGILDDFGLEAAIEWQAKEFEERTGIKCELQSTIGGKNYSKDINTAVFRIFQESLTNVARHAEAKNIKINLREENNALILEVIDNGKGISDERKHNRTSLGLLGMSERAAHLNGKFSIENYNGGGTIVMLHIPLPT